MKNVIKHHVILSTGNVYGEFFTFFFFFWLYNVNTIKDSDSMIAGSECKGDIEGPSCNTARPKRG